ncbi:MAG: SusC/RagA family TonB-linked outer membrane protein [bacterium]
MKNKYFIIITFLCGLLLFAFANSDVAAQQESTISIEATVTDADGNPIPNVEVFSGNAYSTTDANGRFTISMESGARLLVEAKGYENISLSYSAAEDIDEITLEATRFLYDRDDKVALPFRTAHKGDVVGAVSTVNPTRVDEYDNLTWANDILTGRTLGMLGGNSIRGIGIGINVSEITGSGLRSGNALYIVDGLPRNIDHLRADEIESITVLKDVNSTILYGSAAVNGVVLITTKRGEPFKTQKRFSVNSGVSTPRALPKFLNSADYMTYYDMARANDGRSETFGEETIENYRTGNPYRYPSVDYYSDEYISPLKNHTDVVGEFSGGNDDASYYTNFGWSTAGGLLDFGEGANARDNTFNARGNVDLKITDRIKTSIDGSAIFVQDKSQRGNYFSDAASLRPHLYTPLLPFDLIDPENSVLQARKNDVFGEYLLGGTSVYRDTPFGDGYSGGVTERIERNFSFNNRVDFDMSQFTEGLSFHTNISFDYYMRYNQAILNQYSVYEPTWDPDEDIITGLNQHGVDARPGTQSVGGTFFRRRFGAYGQFSYDRTFDGVHHVTGSLIGYGSNFKQQGNYQGVKQAHVGFQLGYVFDKKYMVDFSSAYVNSVRLPEGNKGALSPSLGLAWMISSEDFMASADIVDYLKLRLSGGILNSDMPVGGFYRYEGQYGGSGWYNWYDGSRSRGGTSSNWLANPDLSFASRKEVNFGIEGLFFNQVLGFEANVFYDLYDDQVSRPNSIYPGFYSNFTPWENFGADEYRGAELGLSIDQSFGDFEVFVGVNALYVTSERTEVDEVWDNDYQYRQGHPRDASFGLEAIGFFRDEEDIANSPIQAYGDVVPGDIKYVDQNGDGIVDGNDEVYLRRWQAPLSGGLQLRLAYKNVSLFLLGEGRTGSETFKEGNYYWVDGNKKYSEVVLDSWTPETANTATYPRLSSETNSNNHRRSSFWLYNNDYLQIRRIQLSYDMPRSFTRSLLMNDVSIYADATNIFQFAENREIRDLNVGGEPYYGTFSIGLKARF